MDVRGETISHFLSKYIWHSYKEPLKQGLNEMAAKVAISDDGASLITLKCAQHPSRHRFQFVKMAHSML